MASFKRISLAVLVALGSLAHAEVVSTQTFSYDGRGNLIASTDGNGQTTKYQVDASGLTTVETDALGRITRFNHDILGRTTQLTRPDGKSERYDYDAFDKIVAVTDARGLSTRYEINAFHEVLKRTSPDTGSNSATYDADGRLVSRTNAANQTTSYRYNAAGRLIEQRHAGGPNWSFAWDAKDRITEIKDPNATTRYVYDAENRVAGKTQVLGSLTHTVSYRWTGDRQLAGLTTPSGRKIDYKFKAGQIVGIDLDGKPLLSTVLYHPTGLPQGWTWANGLNHTRLYDKTGRLFRYESAGVVAKLLKFDGTGNITTIDDLLDRTRSQNLTYDSLNRLTTETSTGRSERYDYDSNGNRTSQTRNGIAASYAIDVASNRLLGIEGQTRAYTATGHLQSDGTRSYQYDSAERMIRATVAGTSYQYAYNALGQRVIKTGTRFVFDEQGRLLGEYKTDGSMIQETVWLNDLPVATIRPNASDATKPFVYYIHPDQLGSPRAISDPSANNKTVWRWEPNAFGLGSADEDPDKDNKKLVYNLRFPGQYFDAETGLNYNYFRDYEAATGRYIQSDRIGLYGGMNTYAYAAGNPAIYIDKDGRVLHIGLAMLGGAAWGGFVNALNYMSNGCSGWDGFVNGAVGGAIGGGLSVIGGPAVGGAIGGVVTQAMNRSDGVTNFEDPIQDLGFAAAAGGLGGKVAGQMTKATGGRLPQSHTVTDVADGVSNQAGNIFGAGVGTVPNTAAAIGGAIKGTLPCSCGS